MMAWCSPEVGVGESCDGGVTGVDVEGGVWTSSDMGVEFSREVGGASTSIYGVGVAVSFVIGEGVTLEIAVLLSTVLARPGMDVASFCRAESESTFSRVGVAFMGMDGTS